MSRLICIALCSYHLRPEADPSSTSSYVRAANALGVFRMHFGHQSDWYQNQSRLVLLVEYFVLCGYNMKRALTTAKLHLKRKIQFKIYVHDFEPTCVNFRFSTMCKLTEIQFAVSDLKLIAPRTSTLVTLR